MNAPCCHHRGHRADTKHRGGIRFDQGVVYNCFNCGFSTGWQPGSPIGAKLKNLVTWMGGTTEDIKHLVLEALKTEHAEYDHDHDDYTPHFESRDLPADTMHMVAALTDHPAQSAPVAEYLIDRGFDPASEHWHWTPTMPDRVVIPFRHNHRVIGWTARRITDRRPKYLSDQSPGTVFNMDAQRPDQQWILVCEGPFDAIATGGVALLGNEISDRQAQIIGQHSGHPVLIPDQDRAGLKAIDAATSLGWHTAWPHWDPDVKDCAEAVRRYGQLFVIADAIATAESNPIKIKIARQHLLARLEATA